MEDKTSSQTTKAKRRIAVYTSGGDAPGMNSAIYAVVRTALKRGCEVYGIEEGYQGMVDGAFKKLDWESVTGLVNKGGTIIGTARCKEFMEKEGRTKAVENLLKYGIDSLICIGGDGSQTGADLLRKEWPEHLEILVNRKENPLSKEIAARHPRLNIVGLAGSIDNDMCGTEVTIGADTALCRICETIDYIASTASSHKRAFIIEVMGRNCGYLALVSAICTGADWVFIPENPPPYDWESIMCQEIGAKRTNYRCTIIIIAEGAVDITGRPITSKYVMETLENRLELETRVTIPGHVQRGGPPSAFDRYQSLMVGYEAVNTLLDPNFKEPQLIGMKGYTVTKAPLIESVEKTKRMRTELGKLQFEKILKDRGVTMVEAMKARLATIKKDYPQHSITFPEKSNIKPKRIAIFNVGASAPGMNAAIRTLTRSLINKGHTVLGVDKGFDGFAKGKIKEYKWSTCSGWAPQGGTFMGTKRSLPDPKAISEQIEKHKIDGMVLVSGFEGLRGVFLLKEAAKEYPNLNIPIILIPATISNNIPGTHVSIGIDTATDNVMEAIDKLKQSAISYVKRAFIVEVFGGKCGYLTLMSGLVSEVDEAYLPEIGINLDMLVKCIQTLNNRFSAERSQPAVIVRNEEASTLYTTPFITKLFEIETEKNLSVRQSMMGHVQQGGNPSPLDRFHATRMSVFASDLFDDDEIRVGVVGIIDGVTQFTDLNDLDVDFETRRPKNQWWFDTIRPVFDVLQRENGC